MKEYVLSIAGVVLITSLLSLLLPKGKLSASIRLAAKLVGLLVLIAPFVKFASGGTGFSPELSVDYLSTCERLAEEGEAGRIKLLVEQDFGVTAEIAVDCMAKSPFSVKKITVTVVDFGIFGQEAHIDIMTKIKRAAIEEYGCEVIVSERA